MKIPTYDWYFAPCLLGSDARECAVFSVLHFFAQMVIVTNHLLNEQYPERTLLFFARHVEKMEKVGEAEEIKNVRKRSIGKVSP